MGCVPELQLTRSSQWSVPSPVTPRAGRTTRSWPSHRRACSSPTRCSCTSSPRSTPSRAASCRASTLCVAQGPDCADCLLTSCPATERLDAADRRRRQPARPADAHPHAQRHRQGDARLSAILSAPARAALLPPSIWSLLRFTLLFLDHRQRSDNATNDKSTRAPHVALTSARPASIEHSAPCSGPGTPRGPSEMRPGPLRPVPDQRQRRAADGRLSRRQRAGASLVRCEWWERRACMTGAASQRRSAAACQARAAQPGAGAAVRRSGGGGRRRHGSASGARCG